MAGMLDYLFAPGAMQAPPGFAAMDQAADVAAAREPGTAAEEAEAAREAWAKRLRDAARPRSFGFDAQPVPGIEAVAGMLSPMGAIGADLPALPPSTNDPASGEPIIMQGDVPLPRPKPGALANAQQQPEPAAPLSLAPEGFGGNVPQGAGAGNPMAAMAAAGGDGSPSFLSKLLDPKNAALFLSLGAGFSGAPSFGTGMRRAAGGATPVALQMQKERTTQGNQAETFRALVARGVPQQEAMAAVRNPEIMKALVAKYFETKPAQIVNNRLVREKLGGGVEVLGDFSDDKAPKVHTFDPEKTNRMWDPVSKTMVPVPGVGASSEIAGKLPPDHFWVDPADKSKGVKPIPGSKADKITGEMAGRLALMHTAAQSLPTAFNDLMEGRGEYGTGASGAAASYTNVGKTGRAQRVVTTAIEGVLRAMTGAAAPQQEVERYSNMFMPSPFDSRQTAAQKVTLLRDFIQRATEVVQSGKTVGLGEIPQLLPESLRGTATPLGVGQSTKVGNVTIKRLPDVHKVQ